MLKKSLFLLVLFVLIPAVTAFAQSGQGREDIWMGPSIETAVYSSSDLPLGGGLAIGYGSGTSIGLKISWYFVSENVNTLELDFLFRFYLSGSQAISGPFLQFTGGPAFFFPKDKEASIPAELGMFSAGLNLGWRFLLGNLIFFEPSIRVGYPYLIGGGIFGGIRF